MTKSKNLEAKAVELQFLRSARYGSIYVVKACDGEDDLLTFSLKKCQGQYTQRDIETLVDYTIEAIRVGPEIASNLKPEIQRSANTEYVVKFPPESEPWLPLRCYALKIPVDLDPNEDAFTYIIGYLHGKAANVRTYQEIPCLHDWVKILHQIEQQIVTEIKDSRIGQDRRGALDMDDDQHFEIRDSLILNQQCDEC